MAPQAEPIVPLDTCLKILNITKQAYPAIIFVLFLITFVIYGFVTAPDTGDTVAIAPMLGPGGRPLPQRRKSAKQTKAAAGSEDISPRAKVVYRILQMAVLLSFMVNGAIIVIQTLVYRKDEWWPGQAAVVYVVGSSFVWTIILISMVDTKPSPTVVHLMAWLVAVPLDLLIIGVALQIYSTPHHEPKVGDPQGGRYQENISFWEVMEVMVNLVRAILLAGLSIIFIVSKLAAWRQDRSKEHSDEANSHAPLLGETNANGSASNGHAYGTVQAPAQQQQEGKERPDAWAKPTEMPNITWVAYFRGFVVLIPYLWPKKSIKLQLLAGTCFIIMITQRVITVFVPILVGEITDALSDEKGHQPYAPWLFISIYILFRWLQGNQGILSAIRQTLWIPVEQYSYRAISTAAFEHVHGLSAEFHTSKRTGELISALNKGSAINTFLEMVTFQVGPMIVDLIVAVVFLTIKFDIYLGLVVAIVTFLYIYVTIRMAYWRVGLRREYVNADREMEAVKNDSLHSWDTVKYFNAEDYEFERYRKSIRVMQGLEYWLAGTLYFMNTVQGALFMVALLVACFIEAFQVAQGYQTVGQFVLLITYMTQLQAPLNFFGTFYRSIQTNLINAERMLELFKEQPNVVDREGAEVLEECEGDIIFDNVRFSYDKRKSALDSVSFRCRPGTTTALVGESGGGKTTIMRMMFRFHNPEAGCIKVDGRDVQDITIDSLRQFIGVVPQDCNMFNESIMYNLKYANQDASEEEIFDACRAASIHDRIMQFPDGYNTKVGERGVRLSGGERQRVAIARTILKNPCITLLDEATAALDSATEEKIQESFKSLAKGRTMLIIAHRLSTIVDADQILVLSNGTIIECGTHNELIELEGKYASMWRKQSRAQKAQAEADELRIRADRALKDAEVDSASVSEEELENARNRRNGHKKTPSNLNHDWLVPGMHGAGSGSGHHDHSNESHGRDGKPPGHP